MLDERSIQIIKKIIESSYILKDELMSSCGLTKRQLEYSIEKINDWIKENDYVSIRFLNDKVSIKPETYAFLVKNMSAVGADFAEKYLLSNNERQNYLFLMILSNDSYLSSDHFIYALDVSKATVFKDMTNLKDFLLQHQIEILYTRSKGYHLSGDEAKIRYVAMRMVITCLSIENNRRFLDRYIEENQMIHFSEMLDRVVPLAARHDISFVENRLIEFVYTCIFLLSRLRMFPCFTQTGITQYEFSGMKEFAFSNELLHSFGENADASVVYLCSWLLGFSVGNEGSSRSGIDEIGVLVEAILSRFELLSGITFENRDVVKNQILLHFQPAYFRIMFHLPIVNPLREKIQEGYQELYTLVKVTMQYFEPVFLNQVPEDEIAFLTIHFASLIANFKEKSKMNKVAVVICPNGIGSSMLVYTQLKALFPEFSFLEPIEHIDLDVVFPKVDVIFSTTATSRLMSTEKPFFIVSPIMSDSEKYRLIRDVYAKVGMMNVEFPNINKILKIVKKYVHTEDAEAIEQEIIQAMMGNEATAEFGESKPALHQIIDPSYVRLGVAAADKQEAVRKAGEPLLRDGAITKEYLEAMGTSLEQNGGYMVISKGVALPHANINCGAKKLAIGITVLEQPIVFGNEKNDPVKYIFCLSAVDKERHLQAMSTLLQLLSTPEFYHLMDHAASADELLDFIRDFELKELCDAIN